MVVNKHHVRITVLDACVTLSEVGNTRFHIALHTVASCVPFTARLFSALSILVDEVRSGTAETLLS